LLDGYFLLIESQAVGAMYSHINTSIDVLLESLKTILKSYYPVALIGVNNLKNAVCSELHCNWYWLRLTKVN
jgi:hypothetical protein